MSRPLSIASVLLCGASAAAAIEPPPAEPAARLSQAVGVCEVAVSYTRPAERGRTLFGGELPWGEVFHPGAHEPTTITFSHDARVQGQPIPAGSYRLYAVPNPTEWTIIFNRPAEAAGMEYDPAGDALRVAARAREASHRESLEVTFPDVGTDTVRVELRWAEVAVPFDVTFDVREAAIEAAREFVRTATPADGRRVWNWAHYFYRNGYNTEEALGWATELAEAAPMYFTVALEARLLARANRRPEAVEVARRALEAAETEAGQPGVEADAEALAIEIAAWESGGDPE